MWLYASTTRAQAVPVYISTVEKKSAQEILPAKGADKAQQLRQTVENATASTTAHFVHGPSS